MKNWIEFKGTKDQWNQYVDQFSGNYRQLWEWGEYKNSSSWEVSRLIYLNENRVTHSVQILVKKFFFVCLVYIPGGISNKEFNGQSLEIEEIIFKKFKNFLTVIRFDSNYKLKKEIRLQLIKDSWKRPAYNINRGLSLEFQLDQKSILETATRKWRYNYRKAIKNNYQILIDRYPLKFNSEIMSVANEMLSLKKDNVDRQEAVLELSNYFKKNLIVACCISDNNEFLGFRSALLFGNRSFDIFGAVSIKGRKLKIGYPLLVNLLDECKNRGAINFNFGGYEPSKNTGQFKINSGADLYEYVGEWEKTNSPFFSSVLNILISIRKWIYFI